MFIDSAVSSLFRDSFFFFFTYFLLQVLYSKVLIIIIIIIIIELRIFLSRQRLCVKIRNLNAIRRKIFEDGDLLCHFKYPEQPDATENGNAERWHHVCIRQDHLGDRADHDETIETIEQRDEVTLNSDEYFFFLLSFYP